MSTKLKMLFVLLTFMLFGTTVCLAADQDRVRDRKKDGSCRTELNSMESRLELAADQDRVRDRKKDGSCRS